MSDFISETPSEANLQFVRNDLRDVVHRGIPGFCAKFLHEKSWSPAVQRTLQAPEAQHSVRRFAASVLQINQVSALQEWITSCEPLFTDGVKFTFHLLENATTGSAKMGILVRARSCDGCDPCAFGEYICDDRKILADGERDLLCFFRRAQQVFASQPTRKFLHGFLLNNNNSELELWVFDRAGVYSSGSLNLQDKPFLLLQVLISFATMSASDFGFTDCMNYAEGYITLDHQPRLYLQHKPIASPDYIVGPGTSCYAASSSSSVDATAAVKFSWRKESDHTELETLQRVSEHKIQGAIQLVGAQDLDSITHIRQGLQFPKSFANFVMSCVVTTPLGRPLYQFQTIPQLMGILGDIVTTLGSLYMSENILHRDVAIKNIVWTSQREIHKGFLIYMGSALDLNVKVSDSITGSDGFMAIGVLSGQRHTYRDDLESLFYVFLWLAIGNNREYDHPTIILLDLPSTSRLHSWCSLSFETAAAAKAHDMSTDGFQEILKEFSNDFLHLRDLAKNVHDMIFPLRNGMISTDADTEGEAVERLYKDMSNTFRLGAKNGYGGGNVTPPI